MPKELFHSSLVQGTEEEERWDGVNCSPPASALNQTLVPSTDYIREMKMRIGLQNNVLEDGDDDYGGSVVYIVPLEETNLVNWTLLREHMHQTDRDPSNREYKRSLGSRKIQQRRCSFPWRETKDSTMKGLLLLAFCIMFILILRQGKGLIACLISSSSWS
jgi:hypothetical protein